MFAVANLVRGSVDYAGLFPPAALSMDQVVANYAEYLNRTDRPMLGRVVVPASRLAEFEASALLHLAEIGTESPWRISALVPPVEGGFESDPFITACQTILSFNAAHQEDENQRFLVDSIEIKTRTPDHIEETVERLPTGMAAFLEIDSALDPSASIERLASCAQNAEVFAKIRTGSVIADQVPSVEQVARFIGQCGRNAVAFKATAGLHHPIRNQHRLTYQEDSPCAMLHGFINVFVAALVAFAHRVDDQVIAEVLSETDAANFGFEDHQLTWKGFHFNAARIAELRKKSILSFGSCSFDEPCNELKAILNCHKLFTV